MGENRGSRFLRGMSCTLVAKHVAFCCWVVLLRAFVFSCSTCSVSAATNTQRVGPALGWQTNGLETVLIRGGTFTMGTKIRNKQDSKYHADEAPLRVTLRTFRIAKYPVTAGQMCAFLNSPEARAHKAGDLYLHKDMTAVGSSTRLKYSTITVVDGRYVPRPKAAQAPANLVTWKGAVLFAKWLSGKTGKSCRLPSEAEWEFAARGEEGRKYPWADEDMVVPFTRDIGDRFDDAKAYNSRELAERQRTNLPMWPTTPVGTHPDNATPEGVMDMCAYLIGEWCVNKYIAKLSPQQATNAVADLLDLQAHRVVRGGYKRAGAQRNQHDGLLSFFFSSRGPHGGVAWTRLHAHPLNAPKHAAWYGFRVVEEITKQNR